MRGIIGGGLGCATLLIVFAVTFLPVMAGGLAIDWGYWIAAAVVFGAGTV